MPTSQRLWLCQTCVGPAFLTLTLSVTGLVGDPVLGVAPTDITMNASAGRVGSRPQPSAAASKSITATAARRVTSMRMFLRGSGPMVRALRGRRKWNLEKGAGMGKGRKIAGAETKGLGRRPARG